MATAITLELPDDVYAAAEEAVMLGLASSRTAFFEEAIRFRMREIRHARMDKLAAEAMADPGFRETKAAFRPADKEHWPLYEED